MAPVITDNILIFQHIHSAACINRRITTLILLLMGIVLHGAFEQIFFLHLLKSVGRLRLDSDADHLNSFFHTSAKP